MMNKNIVALSFVNRKIKILNILKIVYFLSIIFSLNFLDAYNVFGQTQPTPTLTLPDQVPPPSDAASLGKYGDVALNMSAGVPNISVPFYQIKTNKLSLPIELNYDASGIKVDQISGWVGLNWSLSAGGVITRTINGEDDLVGGYYQEPIPPQASNYTEHDSTTWNYLERISIRRKDTKPDYFFYNFSGFTGQFIFGEDKNPIDIHHQEPLKINYSPINGVNTFNILDGVGNQYIFAANQNDATIQADGSGTPYVSSWYISQIISADKTDTIAFSYYADRRLNESSLSYSIMINDQVPTPQLISQGVAGLTGVASNPLRLQSINFKNGNVTFYSSGPRIDVAENKLDSIVVNRYDFKAKAYVPLKSLKLSYGYYKSKFSQADTAFRLRLDSVRIKGSSGEDGGKYWFTYNQNQLPLIHSLGRDLFNYYNGKDNNTTLVPNTAIPTATANQLNLSLADRTTYDSYLENGILKRVYYPTTGYSEFSYEPNQYKLQTAGTKNITVTASCGNETHHYEVSFTPVNTVTADVYFNISAYAGGSPTYGKLMQGTTVVSTVTVDPNNGANQHKSVQLTGGIQYTLVADAQANSQRTTSALVSATYTAPDTTIKSMNGGGLRVASVKSYDNAGNYLSGQLYKYGNNEDGFGLLPLGSKLLNTFNNETHFYYGEYQDAPNPGGFGICVQHKNLYDVYCASSIYDLFTLSSQAISYPQVSKYTIDQSGNNIGKSVYSYSVYQSTTNSQSEGFSTFDIINSGYQGGSLLSQIDYAFNAGSFIPVKKIILRYDSIPGPTGRMFKAQRQYNMSGCYVDGYGGTIVHYFADYPVNSGSVLPAAQYTYDYDNVTPANYTLSTKILAYNSSAHLQPVSITEQLSDGTSIVTGNQYPEEKSAITNLSQPQSDAIDQMVQMHNLTQVIKSTITRNNLPISISKNDFKIWSTNQVYLDSVEIQNTTFPIETRKVISNYDANGNIVQEAVKYDANHSYLWDYNNQYPIAEIKNASQSDIAFTSFEAGGNGNWAISSVSRTSSGLGGKLSYPLSGNTLSKSGLSSAKTYIVSYWTSGSSPLSITGTMSGYPVKGVTINGWTNYEHLITGQSSITLSSTTALNIDDVRLYPNGALMSTFTYDALVGMTSSLNEKSELTTYEFDGLQRLVNVKDQYGNIVRHIDYHYKTQ